MFFFFRETNILVIVFKQGSSSNLNMYKNYQHLKSMKGALIEIFFIRKFIHLYSYINASFISLGKKRWNLKPFYRLPLITILRVELLYKRKPNWWFLKSISRRFLLKNFNEYDWPRVMMVMQSKHSIQYKRSCKQVLALTCLSH